MAARRLEEISEEEDLRSRRRQFDRIQPGDLFDLGGDRIFIASGVVNSAMVKEVMWEVIELHELNRFHILNRGECSRSHLTFSQMEGLNLHKRK